MWTNSLARRKRSLLAGSSDMDEVRTAEPALENPEPVAAELPQALSLDELQALSPADLEALAVGFGLRPHSSRNRHFQILDLIYRKRRNLTASKLNQKNYQLLKNL